MMKKLIDNLHYVDIENPYIILLISILFAYILFLVTNQIILRSIAKIFRVNDDLVESISNGVTDLIEKNVFITSYPPKYYYTKLGELKIAMIESAAQDGLLRASTAIEGGGGHLGELLETSIGVFQILGKNSNDNFSWGGTLNTLNKEIDDFKTKLSSISAKIINQENWGLRDLSYTIDKHNKAFYNFLLKKSTK